ncbi:metallophosphoesterase [Candidatus Omnitrophota bacterium]
MRYVISDIHGEYEKLNSLMKFLEKDATEFIFLGDYIDKGIHAVETVNLLIDLSKSKRCTFLIGDHEFAWLQYINGDERFLDFLLKYGGTQTLESYMERILSEEEAKAALSDKKAIEKVLKKHIKFYLNLKFYHEADDFLCIHAGMKPQNKDIPLEAHNKEELVFLRDEFIYSKFFYNGKRIIFGHTAFKEPYVDNYKIGIDAGAVYEDMGYGNLVAFNINKKEFVNHKGEIKKLQ